MVEQEYKAFKPNTQQIFMKWILPVAIGIVFVLLVSGCTQTGEIVSSPKCPESCDDNNPCTSDFCSGVTNYECKHQKIEPCCGNDVCETNEDNINCPDDCPKPTYYCPNGLNCPEMENIVSCTPSTIISVNGDQANYFTLHVDITKKDENCLLYYEILDVKGLLLAYFEIGEAMTCEIPLLTPENIYNIYNIQQMLSFCEGLLKEPYETAIARVYSEMQQQKLTSCIDANVLLQRGIWTETTSPNGTLSLTIYNYGKIPLNFNVMLRYSDTSRHPKGIEIYDETFNVSNDAIELAVLNDISDDLLDVTVKSTTCDPPCYECPAAQDFLRYSDIKGLGW